MRSSSASWLAPAARCASTAASLASSWPLAAWPAAACRRRTRPRRAAACARRPARAGAVSVAFMASAHGVQRGLARLAVRGLVGVARHQVAVAPHRVGLRGARLGAACARALRARRAPRPSASAAAPCAASRRWLSTRCSRSMHSANRAVGGEAAALVVDAGVDAGGGWRRRLAASAPQPSGHSASSQQRQRAWRVAAGQ